MIPGQIIPADTGSIEINPSLEKKTIAVVHRGDRPIQVGSHYHFYEVNELLDFDRPASLGWRLNIPAGTAVRFEPGDEREVELVALAGAREVYGLQNRVDGKLDEGGAQ